MNRGDGGGLPLRPGHPDYGDRNELQKDGDIGLHPRGRLQETRVRRNPGVLDDHIAGAEILLLVPPENVADPKSIEALDRRIEGVLRPQIGDRHLGAVTGEEPGRGEASSVEA